MSLGWTSTSQDVDRAIEVLSEVVPRLQQASSGSVPMMAPRDVVA
jgi:cysteine sulfinate desulfinase/cysteine desulfurase-like protein